MLDPASFELKDRLRKKKGFKSKAKYIVKYEASKTALAVQMGPGLQTREKEVYKVITHKILHRK